MKPLASWILSALLIAGCAATAAHAALDAEDEENIVRTGPWTPEVVKDQKRAEAEQNGISVLRAGGLHFGSDSNVFRSPEDLEEDSGLWGNWILLKSDYLHGKKGRLISSIAWNQSRFPDDSTANSSSVNTSTYYRRSMDHGISWQFDLDVSYQNDDETRISGENFTRDYSYLKTSFETFFVWRASSRHRFKLGGEYQLKNYGETDGFDSQDWSLAEFKARYRLRLGPYHYLRFWYSQGTRSYRDEPAALVNGDEVPGNPAEEHVYRESLAWYTLPIGKDSRLHFKYTLNTKEDRFQDYESYREDQYEVYADLVPSERFELRLGAGYAQRDFDHILGDDGGPLDYTRFNAGVGPRFRVTPALWLFADVSFFQRNSNKDTGEFYRDYEGLAYSAGLSLFL